jgi:hypothetical protein
LKSKQSSTCVIQLLAAMFSKPTSTIQEVAGASLVSATPTLPMSLSSSHGAEMRVAETRAVNRALRKAYGIGIGVCSVDEIGSFAEPPQTSRESKKLPPQPSNGNGNHSGPKVRDRLCQLIRQHQLDPNLVKAYATDFCGVKALRDATREQVETFVTQLADWAEKDRSALLCQLNSYIGQKEDAA